MLPHDTFPADCKLCHMGQGWNTLTDDFAFDHEKETGVPLVGAHDQARCLLCHNDRGPVELFASKGCAGWCLSRATLMVSIRSLVLLHWRIPRCSWSCIALMSMRAGARVVARSLAGDVVAG